jgi:hypothetical protein
MSDTSPANPPRSSIKTVILILVGAILLVGFGVLLEKHERKADQEDLGMSNLDKVTAVVRERRNRLEVMRLRGVITTVRETSGGIGGVFDGKLVIRQPFSTGYFVDMSQMRLSDYIWDEDSKTLFVRLPAVTVDGPNIDATRQQVAVKGWVITRDMQDRLRRSVAQGADQQARTEAAKPEHLEAARSRAIEAITRNLSLPLAASGVGNVHVEVLDPRRTPAERWDVSRSIAEVLAGRG